MGPLLILGILTTAAAGYKFFLDKPKPRYVGDYARVDDEIQVSVNNLAQNNKLLPTFPPNTNWAVVKVEGADKDRIQGPIVGWEGLPRIPAALGSFTVHRVIIDKVIRNGKTVTG